jgi:anaerobic selenocysteine-containing dehydrogenase
MCWFCKGRCGVLVTVEEDGLKKVELDPEYPRLAGSMGAGCKTLRYKAAREWFYTTSRINFPVKRRAARGEDVWDHISWKQALDEIAAKLGGLKSEYGAEMLATSKGDDWTHSEYETRFMSLFGSPNIFGVSPVCWGPRAIVSEAVFGWHPIYSAKPSTKCIVMLGVNIEAGRPALVNVVRQAVRNGAKIITLDPRRSSMAEKSDIWLQLRPGTDAAVLLSMIHHIIEKGMYDRAFVEQWCHGFEELKARAAEYPLSKAKKISGVPEDSIARAAEMYVTHTPGVIFEGMGVEQQTNSVQILHARCILAALAGNVDRKGGEELDGPHPGYVSDRSIENLDELSAVQRKKQIAYDKFRLHSFPGQELMSSTISRFYGERGGAHWYLGQIHLPSLYDTILSGQPYPIKAMIVSASNPMVSHPDTNKVYRALRSLDLLVVMDVCWTPTAQLADYVLPAASWLERPMLYSECGFGKVLEIIEPVVTPKTRDYDRKNDFDLWKGLGERCGQKASWPWRTVEESYDHRLRGKGTTWEEMVKLRHVEDIPPRYEKYKERGFATPTGKVELFSTIFEKLGYEPLPYYDPPPYAVGNEPEREEQYPLTMINGARVQEYMLSTWRNVASVRKRYPDPLVQIHPDTAQVYGIHEGDWIWIENELGRIRQKCICFDGIHKNVIHCDSQWWYPELPGKEPWLHGVWQSNVNLLIKADPSECNQIIGTWPQRMTRVRIYK